MKKIIFALGIVLIILGAWFFMQPKEMVTQDSLGPNPVSAREAKVGDRVGAFTIKTVRVSPESGDFIESINAEFDGTVTVDVGCAYYSDVFGYTCQATGESIQMIPLFNEIAGNKLATFAVYGEGASFNEFKNIIDLRKNADGYSTELTPVRIAITDYRIRYGGTEVGPGAILVEVVE